MIVELRDKVAAVPVPGGPPGGTGLTVAPVGEQIIAALTGLGFAAKQAEQATEQVLAANPEVDTAAALRSALSLLGRNR
jgi:Holliday junction DNA helicase RuvA